MEERKARFIERMGVAFQAAGQPRIAGRIFGLLMLRSDALSLEEMATALDVSRASISTDARVLMQRGFIERRTFPGDRRDYYAFRPDGPRHAFEERLNTMRQDRDLIDEARAVADNDPTVLRRIAGWKRIHEMMAESIERILSEMDAQSDLGDSKIR